jgi:hypothetical protein
MATQANPGREARQKSPTARRQPETLRLRSMMPSYTVSGVGRSIAWYRDGLGFQVSERWEEAGKPKSVMLQAGSCRLGRAQYDFSKGRERAKGRGIPHLVRDHPGHGCHRGSSPPRRRRNHREPGDRWSSYSFTAEDPTGSGSPSPVRVAQRQAPECLV